jgi:response regulator RpfG family c-di-GMP phosphodiesterase
MGNADARNGDSPARILVVDDEASVRELIGTLLTRRGYEVVRAGSARDAIRSVEAHDVSAVLSDINMPGRSGLDLIDELRELRPSLPIVLITGSGDETLVRDALDRGAAGFIAKPFKPAELEQKVAAALARAALVEGELRDRVLAPTVASVLANAIEVRDSGMEGHTERLAALAVEIGRRLELSEGQLEELEMGAVLHDVGKIGIPDSILLKPGPLTPEERTVMQGHAAIGDRLLRPLPVLEPVRLVVRHHHERWDGDGYPDGLAGDEIPLLARIVAVADSIEAMSGPRTYREPCDRDEVVRELEEGRGRQWDPAPVDIALDLLRSHRLGVGAEGLRVLAP